MSLQASHGPSSKGGRVLAIAALALTLGAGGVFAQNVAAPPSSTLDPVKEAANIKAASELDNNPEDLAAVQEVCTACHSSVQWTSTPRSSSRWEQVFTEMSGYGANPTDEQIDQIVRYFQRNLTVINVNESPDAELGPTLQVSEDVAANIALRRMTKKFTDVDDLATIKGVNKEIAAKLKEKGRLQF